jgi:AAA family ATP:ADP antiporter
MRLFLVDAKREELAALAVSFLYFFTLLGGYFILRPLRDEMGIAGGTSKLPWLFTATFVTMLICVPIYSAVVGRWPRRRAIPIVYRFFLLNLVVFFVLLRLGVSRAWVARVFFVWTSVFNLFVVSVFWSFMADLWSGEQGRRLFGFIAAGGSLGGIVGPWITAALVARVGPTLLMLLSCAFLEASTQCVIWLARRAPAREEQAPVGGGVLDGIAHVLRSPYLLAICAQVLGFTMTTTLLYTMQAKIVEATIAAPTGRAELFAQIDTVTNALIVVLQLLISGRLMAWVGLAPSLLVVPIITALGCAGLWWMPALWLLVVVQAVRRAAHHALERPAREVLYTALPRADKYKSKSFIDTVVYRGGDAASAWLGGATLAALPIAGAWLVASLWVARAYKEST